MKLTDAEWQLINALWKTHPTTAKQIEKQLPCSVNWAYTTIKTMLSCLVDKRAINERRQDKRVRASDHSGQGTAQLPSGRLWIRSLKAS